jgi:hypothetical protein
MFHGPVMYQKPQNFSTYMMAGSLIFWQKQSAIIACSLDATQIQSIHIQPDNYKGEHTMSKARDTQKTVKKKAEKTLKEKRNEKKEKKKQKG